MTETKQEHYPSFLKKVATVNNELILEFQSGFQKAANELNSNPLHFICKTKQFKDESKKETSFNGTLVDISENISFSVSENKNGVDVYLFLTILDPKMFNQFYKIEIAEFSISYSDLNQNEENAIINYINDSDDDENNFDFKKIIIKEINSNFNQFIKHLYETQSQYNKKLENFGYLSFSKQLKYLFNNL